MNCNLRNSHLLQTPYAKRPIGNERIGVAILEWENNSNYYGNITDIINGCYGLSLYQAKCNQRNRISKRLYLRDLLQGIGFHDYGG